jgi:hypothetical protein
LEGGQLEEANNDEREEIRDQLNMEDYVKAKSYSGHVFFYGRKVTEESLASNLVYIIRTVIFCIAVVNLQDSPFPGQVFVTLITTSCLFFLGVRYLNKIVTNSWVKFQFVLNEITILLVCVC